MGICGRLTPVIYLSLIQIRVERSVRKRDRYGTDLLACWLRDGAVLVKTGAATRRRGTFSDGFRRARATALRKAKEAAGAVTPRDRRTRPVARVVRCIVSYSEHDVMPDAELWDRIWGVWKGVLFVFLLVIVVGILTVYFGSFLIPLILVTMGAITVILYRKSSGGGE